MMIMMMVMVVMVVMVMVVMMMMMTLLSGLFIHNLMSDVDLALVSLLSDLTLGHDRTLWVAGNVEKRLQERLQV